MRLLLAAAARSTNTRSFVEPFVRRGHDVHVATLHAGAIEGATIHDLGRSERGLSRVSYAWAVPRFRKLHDRLRPDLTLGYYASSYGVLAATAPPPRVIVTAGGDVLPDAQASLFHRLVAVPVLSRFALKRADLVLCWAPHLAAAVAELGVPPLRVLTLPRGIDVARFHPADASPERPAIVSTRALAPFYRPDVLLDAFLALRDRGLDVRLDLIGAGPSLETLASQASSSPHADGVAFPGRLEPDALATHLRGASVYASFPPSEGVSASLLEAMASGLVPVVTRLRTNEEWIDDGINGLLVPEPVSVPGVTAALERALLDDELRSRARSINPERVRERADRDRNALRFEEAFVAVSANRR